MTPVETISVSISIDVPNLTDAIRCYTSALGFTESSAPLPGVAVLRAGNTKICLLEKRAGTRASTHAEETRRYERHWTPVHLDIHVDDLEAALARASIQVPRRSRCFENAKHGLLPSAAILLAMASVSYRGTDSRVGQARGRESFLTVSLTPLNSAIWRQAAGLLGRKSCAIDNILRQEGKKRAANERDAPFRCLGRASVRRLCLTPRRSVCGCKLR